VSTDTNAEIAELLGIEVEPCTCRGKFRDAKTKRHIADYTGSRDAIIGTAETLPPEQQDAIIQHLYETVERDHLATAAEWCAAFLAVMRKEAKP